MSNDSTAVPGTSSTVPTALTGARKLLPGLPEPPAYNSLSPHVKAGSLAGSWQERLLRAKKGICTVLSAGSLEMARVEGTLLIRVLPTTGGPVQEEEVSV